jgi:hypothetical protein
MHVNSLCVGTGCSSYMGILREHSSRQPVSMGLGKSILVTGTVLSDYIGLEVVRTFDARVLKIILKVLIGILSSSATYTKCLPIIYFFRRRLVLAL